MFSWNCRSAANCGSIFYGGTNAQWGSVFCQNLEAKWNLYCFLAGCPGSYSFGGVHLK